MNSKIYLHAGLIKTGSTFLQDAVFSKLISDLEYIDSTDRLNSRDSFQQNKRILLISNENILGHPLLEEKYERSFLDQFQVAIEKGESIFHEPKWIIGFREPSSFIKSVYKQQLHEWGTLSWDEFWIEHNQLIVNGLDFSAFVKFLSNSIPKQRFFLYDFGELKNNPKRLLSEILEFLGCKQNPDLTELIEIAINQKSNVGVADQMIPLLLRLNRLSAWSKESLGLRLALRLGPIKLNPTILVRDYLKYFKTSSSGETFSGLTEITQKYREDWSICKKLIDESRR